jgi:hypothetical protein
MLDLDHPRTEVAEERRDLRRQPDEYRMENRKLETGQLGSSVGRF